MLETRRRLHTAYAGDTGRDPARRAAITVAALIVSWGGATQGATFNLCSQNQLHLGYSGTNQTKVDALRGEFTNQFASTACSVVVLQETMRRALESGPLPQGSLAAIVPSPKTSYITPYTALLGKTSYKESYAFIVATSLPVVTDSGGKTLIWSPSATVAAKFARPPAAILLKTGDASAGEWTWVVNIHSVWGKSASERQREAIAMNEFAVELSGTAVSGHTSSRIVIGGDWNLDATDTSFDTMKNGALHFTLNPNDLTSLTTTGQPSAPYDHFAWSNSVTVTSPRRLTPPSMPTWRRDVSDHMGVACAVTHK